MGVKCQVSESGSDVARADLNEVAHLVSLLNNR